MCKVCKETGLKIEKLIKELEMGRVAFTKMTGIDYLKIRYQLNKLKDGEYVEPEKLKENLYTAFDNLSKHIEGYKLFKKEIEKIISNYEEKVQNEKKAISIAK